MLLVQTGHFQSSSSPEGSMASLGRHRTCHERQQPCPAQQISSPPWLHPWQRSSFQLSDSSSSSSSSDSEKPGSASPCGSLAPRCLFCCGGERVRAAPGGRSSASLGRAARFAKRFVAGCPFGSGGAAAQLVEQLGNALLRRLVQRRSHRTRIRNRPAGGHQ